MKVIKRRFAGLIPGISWLSHHKHLRKLELSSSKFRKMVRDLTELLKILMGCDRIDVEMSPVVKPSLMMRPSCKIRGRPFKIVIAICAMSNISLNKREGRLIGRF